MAIQDINQRQHLIIRRLKRKPSSFNELQEYMEQESEIRGYDLTMSIRTFKRDRDSILSTYGIEIIYNHSLKEYIIDDSFSADVDERIMEAFDLIDTFKINQDLSKFVRFEKRKAIGSEHMLGILHAIKNRLLLHFGYHKYAEVQQSSRAVHPYLLKEFKNRWYLLAKDIKDQKMKTFALDRITYIDIKQTGFIPDNEFNADTFFQNSFGIERNTNDVLSDVILSFTPFQGKYLKSMPLHHTQEIMLDNEQELRIKLKIYLTHDFLLELLSLGANVRVIAPNILIDQLKEHYTKALNQY